MIGGNTLRDLCVSDWVTSSHMPRQGHRSAELNLVCKLTSKQIWGKLSEQTDWFKAKDFLKAEIRGTFRDPSVTPNNILFSVVEVKRNATAKHIIIAKPISQWQDTGMMVSLCSYSRTSSYSAAYCSIQPTYWTYLCVLPRGQWIRTLTHGCVAAPYVDVISTRGYQSWLSAMEKQLVHRQVDIAAIWLVIQLESR